MKIISLLSDRIDLHIKKLCNRLTSRQQLIITVLLFMFFSLAAIYTLTIAAYRVGKEDGKVINIEHIERVPLYKPLKPLNDEKE